MIGEMFFTDIDGDVWQYELNTDPPEATYWANYKLKWWNVFLELCKKKSINLIQYTYICICYFQNQIRLVGSS